MSQPDGAALTVDVEFLASIDAGINRLADQIAAQKANPADLNEYIYPVEIPAQQVKVTAGGALTIASAELLGPRSGFYWDVRRVTITGLASSSENVTVYRGSTGTASDQVANNTISFGAGPTFTYAPGLGACLLRAGQSIVIGGSGLTASELVTATFDAIAVAAPYLGAYLL